MGTCASRSSRPWGSIRTRWWDLSTPEGRQAAYDFLAQSGGTAAGVALGGGGPASIPLGAAGSVGGKQLARTIGPYIGGTGERPDLASTETAIDAATGAVVPALNTAVKAAKPLVRDLVGGSTQNIKRVQEARQGVQEAEAAYAGAHATAQEKGMVARAVGTDEAMEASSEAAVAASKLKKVLPAAQTTEEKALAAVNRAVGIAALSSKQVNLLSAAAYVVATPCRRWRPS